MKKLHKIALMVAGDLLIIFLASSAAVFVFGTINGSGANASIESLTGIPEILVIIGVKVFVFAAFMMYSTSLYRSFLMDLAGVVAANAAAAVLSIFLFKIDAAANYLYFLIVLVIEMFFAVIFRFLIRGLKSKSSSIDEDDDYDYDSRDESVTESSDLFSSAYTKLPVQPEQKKRITPKRSLNRPKKARQTTEDITDTAASQDIQEIAALSERRTEKRSTEKEITEDFALPAGDIFRQPEPALAEQRRSYKDEENYTESDYASVLHDMSEPPAPAVHAPAAESSDFDETKPLHYSDEIAQIMNISRQNRIEALKPKTAQPVQVPAAAPVPAAPMPQPEPEPAAVMPQPAEEIQPQQFQPAEEIPVPDIQPVPEIIAENTAPPESEPVHSAQETSPEDDEYLVTLQLRLQIEEELQRMREIIEAKDLEKEQEIEIYETIQKTLQAELDDARTDKEESLNMLLAALAEKENRITMLEQQMCEDPLDADEDENEYDDYIAEVDPDFINSRQYFEPDSDIYEELPEAEEAEVHSQKPSKEYDIPAVLPAQRQEMLDKILDDVKSLYSALNSRTKKVEEREYQLILKMIELEEKERRTAAKEDTPESDSEKTEIEGLPYAMSSPSDNVYLAESIERTIDKLMTDADSEAAAQKKEKPSEAVPAEKVQVTEKIAEPVPAARKAEPADAPENPSEAEKAAAASAAFRKRLSAGLPRVFSSERALNIEILPSDAELNSDLAELNAQDMKPYADADTGQLRRHRTVNVPQQITMPPPQYSLKNQNQQQPKQDRVPEKAAAPAKKRKSQKAPQDTKPNYRIPSDAKAQIPDDGETVQAAQQNSRSSSQPAAPAAKTLQRNKQKANASAQIPKAQPVQHYLTQPAPQMNQRPAAQSDLIFEPDPSELRSRQAMSRESMPSSSDLNIIKQRVMSANAPSVMTQSRKRQNALSSRPAINQTKPSDDTAGSSVLNTSISDLIKKQNYILNNKNTQPKSDTDTIEELKAKLRRHEKERTDISAELEKSAQKIENLATQVNLEQQKAKILKEQKQKAAEAERAQRAQRPVSPPPAPKIEPPVQQVQKPESRPKQEEENKRPVNFSELEHDTIPISVNEFDSLSSLIDEI